ncbi:MAG: hypothetical protein AAF718_04180 [Pseudomonadota bacterium]
MKHTPPLLSLSTASLDVFLALLPCDRITRTDNRITIHADAGDAVWHRRRDRWVTTAPGDDTARRFGPQGLLQ